MKLARSPTAAVPTPPEKPSEGTETKDEAIDVETDDNLSIDEAPDDKELLEQDEDDVEDGVQDVIETNVSGDGPE